MKRLIVALMMGTVLACFGAMAAQAATTPPPDVVAMGVANPDSCGIGVGFGTSGYSATGTFKVNNSGKGNVLFQCSGDLTTPAPSKGLVINSDRSTEFACWNGSAFVFSNDWSIVITPSGNLKYSCHAKA